MTATLVGALLAAAAATGVLELLRIARIRRRPTVESRVAPYVRDVTVGLVDDRRGAEPWAAGRVVFGPSVRRAAQMVERVLGGTDSVRRRLQRCGASVTVEEFRVSQVVWGAIAFGGAALVLTTWSLATAVRPLAGLVVCAVAGVAGVLARDVALTHQVRRHEERMTREFPTLADLLALSVAAGEGPVSALERVAAVSRGAMAGELRVVVADVRTGRPLTAALVERGTPLVEVLHAQAADVRESGRRDLVESAARREVLMLVPVVFLVLPVTVLFAFYPGLVSLSLTTP
jgi:tight adherence protein C